MITVFKRESGSSQSQNSKQLKSNKCNFTASEKQNYNSQSNQIASVAIRYKGIWSLLHLVGF